MNPRDLQEVRSIPLFATLTDDQLGCLDEGEIIEAPVGTILASEGERTGFFHVLLEGEVRATRTYDRQSILLGVNKPGNYLGETMLLLDIPWLATCRVSKPARLFRVNEASFWRMLVTCQSVGREIFRSAANRMPTSAMLLRRSTGNIYWLLPRKLQDARLPTLTISRAATARKQSPTGSTPMASLRPGNSHLLL